jgi:hypothetical protein
MIDLEAIRARVAAGVYESATADMANVHFKIAADDRRALLAYVDALVAATGRFFSEYDDGTVDGVAWALADLRALLPKEKRP